MTHSKRRLGGLVALTLAATPLALGVMAGAAHADTSLAGSGTAADPYRIATADDLDAAAVQVDADTAGTGAAAAFYTLTADIDYAAHVDSAQGLATPGSFGGFTTFAGTFDGAGHTISNATWSTGTNAAMFVTLTGGAVVENLGLDHVTATSSGSTNPAGLAATLDGATVTGNRLTSATVTNPGTTTSSAHAGGLVGVINSGANTISDNLVWDVAVTGYSYAGAVVSGGPGVATVERNLVDATVTTNRTGTTAVSALIGPGSLSNANYGAQTVTDNVVFGGTATVVSGGEAAGVAVKPGSGTPVDDSTDLISTDVQRINQATGSSSGLKASSNGVATDPADLQQQQTYADLGWDFANTWVWDDAANHPTLPSVPTITGDGVTATFGTSETAPSGADVLAKLADAGLAIDHGALGIDLSDVDFETAGTYSASVTGSYGPYDATPVTVMIKVLPVPVISVVNSEIDYSVGASVTAADVLAQSGAALPGDGTLSVEDLASVDTGTAGSYTVHIDGTDSVGVDADPVAVQVVIEPADTAVIHLTTARVVYQTTATPPTSAEMLTALGATATSGTLSLTTAADFGQPGDYPATITADGATAMHAVITVAPTPVIDTTATDITVPGGQPLTAAAVIAATGATLSVDGTVTVDVSGVAVDHNATYHVELDGTDVHGFAAEPVTVTIHVAWATAPVLTLDRLTAQFPAGADPDPTAQDILSALGATIDHGAAGIDTSLIDFDTPGVYPVDVTGVDGSQLSAPVSVNIVVWSLPGTGIPSDPYLIGSAADFDLAVAATDLDTAHTGLSAASYRLVADIDYNHGVTPGFDYFSGTFDGNGHTIRNIEYGPSTTDQSAPNNLSLFHQLTGGTVKDLGLLNVTINNQSGIASGGIAAIATNATITGVSMRSVRIAGASASGHSGGLVGSAHGPALIADNEVIDAQIADASAQSSPVVSYATGPVQIVRNLVSGTINSPAGRAGLVLAYVGGGASSSDILVEDNVVLGGSVTNAYGGRVVGVPPAGASDPTLAGNLVNSSVTVNGATVSGGTADSRDGEDATTDLFDQQSTYTDRGWDFTTPVWRMDDDEGRPVLANVPEVHIPMVTLTSDTAYFQTTGSAGAPTTADVLEALGATVDRGDLQVDLSRVDITTPGTYPIQVKGVDGAVVSEATAASVVVVPVATVTPAVGDLYYVVGGDVSAEQMEQDAGLAFPDGSLTADLDAVDFTAEGSYAALFTPIDAHGFAGQPATVTVHVLALPGDPGSGDPGSGDGGVTPGNVTIVGTARVGETVHADPGSWTPAGTPEFQWLLDGVPVAGATDRDYVVAPADAGHLVQVRVTEDGVSATSAAITTAAGVIQHGSLAVHGTPRVGGTLTATISGWSPTPAVVAYQWLRNGVPIPGATAGSYTLAGADAGASIAVMVSAVRDGYAPVHLTSSGLPGLAASLRHPARVAIKGRARIGALVRVGHESWTSGTHLTYRWFANGHRIAHATKAKLKLRAKQKGKKITVRVTGTKVGYATVTIASKATKAVKK